MAKMKVSPYIRKEIYHPQTVLRHAGESAREFDGDVISMTSQRYRLFAKSCTCVRCGIVGSYMAKERSRGSQIEKWHFNLYAINQHGREVLMTKDHIIPKSKGGPDTMDNYQTMCTKCNSKKGDRLDG